MQGTELMDAERLVFDAVEETVLKLSLQDSGIM